MKKFWFFAFSIFIGVAACQSQTKEKQAPGYQELDIAAFKAKMSGPDVVLLDVRSPEEIAEGKIEGAKELNFHDENFEAELAKFDKNKTYLVYCLAGSRSSKACKLMSEQGFTKVYNLTGGYQAWSKQ